MCGRYALHSSLARLARRFGVPDADTWDDSPGPGYNLAPGRDLPVCLVEDGVRGLRAMRWGLVPSWARDESIGQKLVNARGETVAEKPSFRSAFRRRRCLVPADGFFEWQPTGSAKQPWYIGRSDGEPLAMAGLWESRPRDDGPPLLSFTIVTTTANAALAHVHARMPVILDDAAADAWLDAATPTAALGALLRPWPDELTAAHRVGRQVNNARHDAPDCIVPVGSSTPGS